MNVKQSGIFARTLLASVMATSLLACGGGGGGGSSGGSSGATYTKLPEFSGLGLVTHIESHDLNDDGRQDLIFFVVPDHYNGNAQIKVLLNGADGFVENNTYFPSSLFPTSGYDNWVESAQFIDINGDGFKDIIPHRDLSRLSFNPLIWNNASKRFEALLLEHSDFVPAGFIAIDVDADGDLDLISRNADEQKWYVFRQHEGEFTFETEPLIDVNSDSLFMYGPVVTDVDNDGRDDLILGGPKWSGGWVDEAVPLIVMLNKADGWVQADNADIFTGDTPSFTHLRLTRVADFNNDGYLDVAIANHGYDAGGLAGEYNGVLLNTGNGGFNVNISSTAFNYKGFTHAMDIGDINNDGYPDIVYADITGADVSYNKRIRVLINNGSGGFTHSNPSHPTGGDGWTAAKLVDLNGDGYLDLVLGGQNAATGNYVIYNKAGRF